VRSSSGPGIRASIPGPGGKLDPTSVSQTVLHLTGAAPTVGVDASTLRDLLDVLVDAVQLSVRMRAEGTSRLGGSAPAWLDRAATFTVWIPPASTQVTLDAQALGDLVPEKFAQVGMSPPLDPRATCLDVFADALDDALLSKIDSDLYDADLVETLTRFGRVLDHGLESLEISNGRTRILDSQSVQSLRELRRRFPADQRTRIAGWLGLLKHNSSVFSLTMSAGEVHSVIAAEVDFASLGQLVGQQVIVLGTAKFRPSGIVQRIEADQIISAEGDTAPWEASPRPLFSDLDAHPLRVAQGPRSGVAAMFGQWPGDENQADFEDAVRDL